MTVIVKDLTLRFGAITVLDRLNLEIADGEFLVLLGASGCGKSTLLNCIAGLLDISEGQIFIGGKNVTWAEPSDRGIGMVFQSYALYPQMTVRGNLSFGLKIAGLPKDEIEKRVERASEILQIGPLMDRKPGALSGGQRQRVAIGRALVRDVDVFLFDEPLSNLDAKLRADLRVEIKRLHQRLKNTMIYVTHDQIEALTLADRIAVMRNGIVQQLGSPREIYGHPINKYVAGFIGSPSINFLKGEIKNPAKPILVADGLNIPLSGYEFASAPLEGKVTFGIRPEHIVAGPAAKSLPFSQSVEIEIVEPMGSDTLVWARLAGQEFRFRVDGQSEFSPGQNVHVGFDPARASMFDAASELRL
jgi:multiple sugar transport system ATP-binding protein